MIFIFSLFGVILKQIEYFEPLIFNFTSLHCICTSKSSFQVIEPILLPQPLDLQIEFFMMMKDRRNSMSFSIKPETKKKICCTIKKKY